MRIGLRQLGAFPPWVAGPQRATGRATTLQIPPHLKAAAAGPAMSLPKTRPPVPFSGNPA